MKHLTFLLLTGGLLATPAVAAPALAHDGAAHAPAARTATAIAPAPKLQAALRELWHGHVVHTRDYAFAVKAGDAARGQAAGERMLALLAGHWGAVKAMTDAGERGDTEAGNAAMATLTKNAGEIAVFLSGANPNLPEDAVRGLLVAHGAHHAAQIAQVMRGDLAGEKTTWTAMQAHMDTIADAMAAALAKQFPDKAA